MHNHEDIVNSLLNLKINSNSENKLYMLKLFDNSGIFKYILSKFHYLKNIHLNIDRKQQNLYTQNNCFVGKVHIVKNYCLPLNSTRSCTMYKHLFQSDRINN